MHTFQIEVGYFSVQYGLVYVGEGQRKHFPGVGKEVVVIDEEGHEYPTHMHTLHPRIDGLSDWYDRFRVKKGDRVEVQVDGTRVRLRLLRAGARSATAIPPLGPLPPIHENSSRQAQTPDCRRLVARLQRTQGDSENHESFERALQKAFQFLGFDAQHVGRRNEPDILIRPHGVILDAKSTERDVINEPAVNFNALRRYRDKYGAKYVGVVARGFSKGNIRDTAHREGVSLIETAVVCQMLRIHAARPYKPLDVIELLFGNTARS